MHVAGIEKTIKGYIWTCLPSIFQDINLMDPENSERGDRDTPLNPPMLCCYFANDVFGGKSS